MTRDERLLAPREQIAEGDVELEGHGQRSRAAGSGTSTVPIGRAAVSRPHHAETGSRRESTGCRSAASPGDRCRRPRRRSAAGRTRARGRSPRPSRAPRRRPSPAPRAAARSGGAARPGSFSSLKALATSKPPTYSSKRSTVSGSSRLLLRERRDLGREVVDEGRLHELILPQRFEDRRRAPCPRRRRRLELDAEPRRDRRAPSPRRAGPRP